MIDLSSVNQEFSSVIHLDCFIPKRKYEHIQDEIKNASSEGLGSILADLRTFCRPVENLLKICEEVHLSHEQSSGLVRVIPLDVITVYSESINLEHRRSLLRKLKGIDPKEGSEWTSVIKGCIWDVRHEVAWLKANRLTIETLKFMIENLNSAVDTLRHWTKHFEEQILWEGMDGYVSAENLFEEIGITRSRLSAKVTKQLVRVKRAPRGMRDSQGRQIRKIYHREDAKRHCRPMTLRSIYSLEMTSN